MDSEEPVRGDLFHSETSAVFLGILILALFILWISSLYLVRREDDPARIAFTYMKVVYPMAFFTQTFRFTHLMLNIAMHKILLSHASDETPPDEFLHRMNHISNRLDALSSTLLDATDVFLILTLFELGNGFLLCLTAVLYLATVTYIRGCSFWITSFSMDVDSEQRIRKDIEELEEWDTPLLILWVVASLLLLAYACFVSNKAKGKPLILDSTVIFLGPTALNLINPGRHLVITILDLDKDTRNINWQYFYLLDDILDYGVRFFIIALIYAIGLQKDNELLTTQLRLPSDLVLTMMNSIKG
ncbi:Fc.00g105940.m01.CDS01 [Cosmosporella sp. VM-42]